MSNEEIKSMIAMKKTTIKVTREDIIEGDKWESSMCPVARAIDRRLKPNLTAYVAWDYIDIYSTDPRGDLFYRIPTPDDVVDFIGAFDEGVQVKPFSFNLKVPESLLND